MSKSSKIREKARKKMPILLKQQDHKCKYCNREIFPMWLFPEAKQNGEYAVYFNKETNEEKKVLYATIDHIVPLSYNMKNPNSLSNLVASCMKCNQARHNSLPMKRICEKCSCVFIKHKSSNKKCIDCAEYDYVSYLVLNCSIS